MPLAAIVSHVMETSTVIFPRYERCFLQYENVGRVTARTRRGRYYYQGPARTNGQGREQCLAPYGAQGAPSGD